MADMNTHHLDMEGGTIRRTRPTVSQCVLWAVFLIFTWWRWDMLWASVSSLFLAALTVLLPAGGQAGSIRWDDLIEYWIAGLVWIVLLLAILMKVIGFFRGNRQKPLTEHRWFNTHVWVVVSCCLLAAEAPILSPFDPMGQGDLRTTRLVVPLSTGYAITPLLPPDHPSIRQPGLAAGVLSKLNESSERLLHRHATFTLVLDGTEHASVAPRTAHTLLGTDNLGRDVISRLLYGLRLSLIIGISSMVLSVLIGMIAGFIAGFARYAWVDQVIMRVVDLFLAIPSLFFIIAVLALFGNSTTLLVLVLAGTGWMGIARLVRGEVVSLRHREFILAARMLGRNRVQIVLKHLLPNVLPVIKVAAVLQLANVVLAEASLSFLGLGIRPPAPSLGNMIGESMGSPGWWVGVFPGVILTVFLFSVNRVSDYLQHAKIGGASYD